VVRGKLSDSHMKAFTAAKYPYQSRDLKILTRWAGFKPLEIIVESRDENTLNHYCLNHSLTVTSCLFCPPAPFLNFSVWTLGHFLFLMVSRFYGLFSRFFCLLSGSLSLVGREGWIW
jgi:hypothetical protein